MRRKIVISCKTEQELEETVQLISKFVKYRELKKPKRKSGEFYKAYIMLD
nr:hypothetical protein [uncultured Lachnoclostridium sp.]